MINEGSEQCDDLRRVVRTSQIWQSPAALGRMTPMVTQRPAGERQPRLFSDMRGVRYGEVLAVFNANGRLQAEVYGTQMLNDCPQELWGTLDAAAIAEELGALLVKLNG